MARTLAAAPGLLLLTARAYDDIGYDGVSQALNEMIRPSDDYWSCIYCGGKGVMVRSPDSFEDDPTKVVVPGTFWSNDLFMPSQIYPAGDPNCPTDWQACDADPYSGDLGPWNNAQLGAVIGSAMDQLFTDFDHIQDGDWGWGVFYSTDSNACDGRCRWRESDGGYDCPKGWLWWGGGFTYDESFQGAGEYSAGNPYAGGGGGGAGCHFNSLYDSNPDIDQVNGDDGQGTGLVRNGDCECNYDLLLNADDWIDHWLTYGGYSGPSSSMDVAACWVNNPRDMIKLQNKLFWRKYDWNDGSRPWARWGDGSDPASHRPYWGWNEVPVDSAAVNDPLNWDAIMIKLPAILEGDGTQDRLSMLDAARGTNLEDMLNFYVYTKGMLVPGSDNVQYRPGSSVVIVREMIDSTGNFQREFFCETWFSPNGAYAIYYYSDMQICYVEWGSQHTKEYAEQYLGRAAGNSSRAMRSVHAATHPVAALI